MVYLSKLRNLNLFITKTSRLCQCVGWDFNCSNTRKYYELFIY